MFSALKKLTSKNDGSNIVIPESVGQSMSDSLRKKFSKGVQYNMKVIIKGDRNVGKSCLLERLQGKAFLEQYTPTEQIQVASIQWSFKATDDIVKVEVWDVVDRGKSRPRSSGLKLNMGKQEDTPILDAEFLDVYKGTQCVIMMMDITKAWTFEYVCRELPKIPVEIPVLLLGNHCDMGHHRVITKDQVTGLVEEAGHNRLTEIVYGESSMRNGFGLRLLHKFLGIPFLYLQKSTLEASLKKNAADADICRLEINEFIGSDETNYSSFLDNLINKRRQAPESAKSPLDSMPTSPVEFKPTKSIIIGAGHPIIIPDKSSHSAVSSTSIVNTAKLASPVVHIPKKQNSPALPASVDCDINVDEFCPDGGVLDKSFLEDAIEAVNYSNPNAVESESDDDSHHNPLVARFEEEISTNQSNSTASAHQSDATNPAKRNPLTKSSSKSSSFVTDDLNESIERKLSLSSFEIENPNSNFSIDDYESWSLDTKLRRSPEGGEDIVSTTSSHHIARDAARTESERKVKDKEKKHKKKKSSREKDETRDKKKKSKKKDNVEDFLNEMKSSPVDAIGTTDDSIDEAYEAI